jgi:hypothetical protein
LAALKGFLNMVRQQARNLPRCQRETSAKLARKNAPEYLFIIYINEIAGNKKIAAKFYFPFPNAPGRRGKKVGNKREKGWKMNYKSIKLLNI